VVDSSGAEEEAMKNFLWLLGGVVIAVFITAVYFLIAFVKHALDWEDTT
jgi:hypothetical protein